MPVVSFDITQVKLLVENVRAAAEVRPTMDMLFDAKYYKDQIIRDKAGLTEFEVKKKGGHFWPSADHIDNKLVEPVLQLVGDQGVYLINNALNKLTPSESGLIVYAQGINPDIDEDWYDAKRHTFGGDDGSVTVPLDWFDIAIARKGVSSFSIKLTHNSIELV
jgi:hypothetical protein